MKQQTLMSYKERRKTNNNMLFRFNGLKNPLDKGFSFSFNCFIYQENFIDWEDWGSKPPTVESPVSVLFSNTSAGFIDLYIVVLAENMNEAEKLAIEWSKINYPEEKLVG